MKGLSQPSSNRSPRRKLGIVRGMMREILEGLKACHNTGAALATSPLRFCRRRCGCASQPSLNVSQAHIPAGSVVAKNMGRPCAVSLTDDLTTALILTCFSHFCFRALHSCQSLCLRQELTRLSALNAAAPQASCTRTQSHRTSCGHADAQAAKRYAVKRTHKPQVMFRVFWEGANPSS